ncbi:MAG: HAD-IA family hydrolase [Salinivenus sp.]
MSLSCHAVIFDLDGVLIDSQAAIRQRWKRWAAHHDIPFDEVESVYHGRPMAEVIAAVAPQLDVREEMERMNQIAGPTDGELRPFEGAAALLDALPEGRWTIATSGRRSTATRRLQATGLPIPDTLVTADDVAQGKPAPDPYQLAADRLSVAPDRCVVFEDAPAGVEAARRAGAAVVGIASHSAPVALDDAAVVLDRLSDARITNGSEAPLRVTWTSAALD